MATKHMNAAPGDFAETVLMPGDPLRAQYIADTYFDNPRRVTDVRYMWGFTGEYKGTPVSVQAHGMGIPSASIYCTELISEYDVKRVIRVGSCGTTHPDVKLRDVLIAMGASTDSGVNRMRFGGYDLAALATYSLVRNAVQADLGIDMQLSSLMDAQSISDVISQLEADLKSGALKGAEIEGRRDASLIL